MHLTDRGDKRRVTRPERCRVEQRCIEGLVVCFVELVDDLAFDVRVKNLDFEAEFGGVTADSLIVFGRVIGPKISVWTLPRMFIPAPWITRTFAMPRSSLLICAMLVDRWIR